MKTLNKICLVLVIVCAIGVLGSIVLIYHAPTVPLRIINTSNLIVFGMFFASNLFWYYQSK